ncbi:MAG: FG-GAP repeat protein [Ignavibacteria bacterium]|nr:FG-GAP repeat protein [Ignavibacteria bacterium]
MNGEATAGYFGFSVSNAGDVNGDGYSDIIVGAYFNIERAYIYFGGLTMDNIADVTLSGTGGYFGFSVSTAGDVNRDGFSDVIVGQPAGFIGSAFIFYGGSSMNSVPDVTMMDENPSTFFGLSVSDAGDVNGDGYPDVIIGADFTDSRTGRAYIYFGSATMDNNADVILYGEST